MFPALVDLQFGRVGRSPHRQKVYCQERAANCLFGVILLQGGRGEVPVKCSVSGTKITSLSLSIMQCGSDGGRIFVALPQVAKCLSPARF